MSSFSNWNGKIVNNEDIHLSADNRSFRYGEGFFETIKVIGGRISLQNLHFERLFSSLQILKFTYSTHFSPSFLKDEILSLVQANHHSSLARVRLVIYAGNGGLYDTADRNVNYIIQSWPGSTEANNYNTKGLKLGVFKDAQKACDFYSSIKSNNYLGYAMAAIWAKENGLDDCLLTNAFNRIADATIANIFIVTNGFIKTPSISEGCINGVMRRYLLSCFKKEALPFTEGKITYDELLSASEIFLSNANFGLRWVQRLGNNEYKNDLSLILHKKFIQPLFSGSTF